METHENTEALEAVAFLGETLGPLFLFDPADDHVAPLYEQLRQIDAAGAAADWPYAAPDEAASAFALMAEGLSREPSDELAWEYRRLFVGPAAKAAPPWGSVYTDRDCVIFGRSTLDLRAWMRATGIKAPGASGEPEDHIGLMLLLAAWIARERPELLREYLEGHLLTWAPHFLNVVREQTRHPFFDGLSLLASSSLEGMREELDLDVEVPRFYR